MLLDQLNLVVADMEATVRFYRLLGVEVPDSAPEWQAHHRSAALPGGMDLDFDSLAFARVWNTGAPVHTVAAGARAGGVVIGFRCDSRAAVDACYARIVDAGYRTQQPPFDAFWGARYAIVEDPDGNAVGLMSPVDAALRKHQLPPG